MLAIQSFSQFFFMLLPEIDDEYLNIAGIFRLSSAMILQTDRVVLSTNLLF